MASHQATLRRLVVGLVAALVASLLAAAPAAAQTGVFDDVVDDAYYSVPVAALAEDGVFAGTECGDSGFCPSDSLDRQTMAVWTVRVLDGADPAAVSATRFADVQADSFFAPFIERMAELGVTAGCGDGTAFCPDASVTRAQMAVFLTRAFSLAPGPDPGFSDVPADAWYFDQMTALAASGITKGCGDGTVFCPDRDTSRAQMATFLYRALHREGSEEPVRVPNDGEAAVVASGASFVAEFDSVTVEGPAGALSGAARLSLSDTRVGAGRTAEGEVLAAGPIAVSVTGAEIVEPLTLRFKVDTESLSPTGVVPAWWSSELDTWVPLDAQDVVIADGEVVVKATLADARPVDLATASGSAATLFAGSGGLGPPPDSGDPTLAVPLVVIGLIIFVGTFVAVGVVALTSDHVHDVLKRLFGLVAREPVCDSSGLPSWVDALSDSEGSQSDTRARLHTCGQSAGDDLLVKVVNNRNYGIQFNARSGMTPVTLADGPIPLSGLDILLKETAEEVIGDSYLWPLSGSEFALRRQQRDWSGEWRPTGATAVVDGIRVGIDLLKTAVPGISLAEVTQKKLADCIKDLLKQGAKILRGSFNIWNFDHWVSVLKDVSGCFISTGGDGSEQANAARDGLKEVNKALGWISTANSAAKWALTAADAIKDSRRDRAWINMSVPDDDQDGISDECDSDQDNDGTTDDQFRRPDLDGDGLTDDCDDDRDGDQIRDVCESDRDNDGVLDTYARDRDDDGIVDYGGCDTDIDFSVVADSTFSAVSAGQAPGQTHSCALRTDGTIQCWGYNTDGQADGPDGQFNAVSAGGAHTCALQNLSINCWGNNDHGQTQQPVGAFRAVSAGPDHSCGLLVGGSIKCWGNNSHGQIDVPSGRFSDVSAGENVSCAVTTDGAVTCWGAAADWSDTTTGPFTEVAAGGSNSCALGTDHTITCQLNTGRPLFPGTQPEQPTGTFSALSVNADHGCGLTTANTITCWGWNAHRRTEAPQGTHISVSAGYEHSCAVRTDGTITCWGRYSEEQQPDTSQPDRAISSPPQFSAVSAGVGHSCGLRTNGTIQCWGFNDDGQTDAPEGTFSAVTAAGYHSCGLRTNGIIQCWGYIESGQTDAPEGTFSAVTVGQRYSCAMRTNGTIHCWGYNDDGQTDAPEGTFSAVSAGSRHSCGLRTNGTIQCWGHNSQGQTDAPEGTFSAVSAGSSLSCGLRTNGTIQCWGYNYDGQSDAPEGTFSAVTAGGLHSCGLRTNGTIQCWGHNQYGADAPEGTFSAVSAGVGHSCGLRTNGTIQCWGHNEYGETDAPQPGG